MRYVNESVLDRAVRVVIGAALLYLGWFGVIDGGWGTFLKFFGLIPLLTGVVGWCPIYALVGFRTNRRSPVAVSR
jgi:hypothetical protein